MQSLLPKFLSRSFLRWAVVGVVTTGCDFFLFLIFYNNLNSVFVSNFLSSVIATSINYFAHHRWTFSSARAHTSSAPRYFLSLVFWWLLSTFLIKYLIDSGMNVEFAKIAPSFLILPLNYIVLNKVVFDKRI
jgi:putative flippase GtrA